MKWVTRERPKTDRIACPWLIRKFIDPDAAVALMARVIHGADVSEDVGITPESAWVKSRK